ncbi:MAG: hypothetical protein LBB18_02665 [Puniceicoccales bacterium]|jgi:4-diphosphocytidyl-2-C-methyl-D-erythritol kinase|nr:hypothetical protein [Puniceicoccales bacterium]
MSRIVKSFSPAKLNLFFAITGLRSDGYHNVFSANVAVNFGDEISICCSESGVDEISCDADFLDKNNNTIIAALNLFRSETGFAGHFSVNLKKRIPPEAGFGGGSSNAAVTLLAANEFAGNPLSSAELAGLGGKIGADCTFFFNGPSVTTGVGDVCEPIDARLMNSLGNYDLLIFKPKFGVNTVGAYATLREKFQSLYTGEMEARRKFSSFEAAIMAGEAEVPLFNTFTPMVLAKHGIVGELFRDLNEIGANVALTGSGSGCFCLCHGRAGVEAAKAAIKRRLGVDAFVERVWCLGGPVSTSIFF